MTLKEHEEKELSQPFYQLLNNHFEQDDEMEPATKKIVIDKSETSSSSVTYIAEDSSTFKSSKISYRHKSAKCSGCKLAGTAIVYDNNKEHRLCYPCFVMQAQTNNFSCPDATIKLVMSLADYTIYLRHICDALSKKFENNKKLEELVALSAISTVKNVESFDCPICFSFVEKQDGVTLKNCLHQFCIECIDQTVANAEGSTVFCPFNDDLGACEMPIQECEIKALTTEETFNIHLEKSIKQAELSLMNMFHCKTPDCRYFLQYSTNCADEKPEFMCPICCRQNCIKCNAIHTGESCDDFKDRIKKSHQILITEITIRWEVKRGLVRTEHPIVKVLIESSISFLKAMFCPRCKSVIKKEGGCDFVRCSACQLGLCFITQKPRQSFVNDDGELIEGCNCGVNGKKCHVNCNSCH